MMRSIKLLLLFCVLTSPVWAQDFSGGGSGGGSGSNASVGTNGSAAPSSSTQAGFVDGSGNLQAASPTKPFPITEETPLDQMAGISALFARATQGVQGGYPFSELDAGNTAGGNGIGTCAATCNGTALFGPLDTSGFGGTVDMVYTVFGSATVTYQESDDNATWNTTTGCFTLTNFVVTTTTVVGTITCPVRHRWFRAQFTAYASGTITAFWVQRKVAYFPPTSGAPYGAIQVSSAATGTTGAVTANIPSPGGVAFPYLCGFNVSATGTGSCLASNGATNIVVTTTADASASAVDLNLWGYRQ